MLKIVRFQNLWIFLLLLTYSCTESEDSIPKYMVTTTVRGNVSDVERGIIHKNFKVTVVQYVYGGGYWSGYGISETIPIDDTLTDDQGNYEIIFDYDTDPKYKYGLQFESLDSAVGPFADILNTDGFLEEGIINIRDIDYWYASILKLNLKVTNNGNPKLYIRNNVSNNITYFFMPAEIVAQTADTIIYLPTKPNANIDLLFNYSTGNTNADAHKKIEFLTNSAKDTIEVSYEIDCASF